MESKWREGIMHSMIIRSLFVIAMCLSVAILAGCSGGVEIVAPVGDAATANNPFSLATKAAFEGDLDYVKQCVESDPRYVQSVDDFGRTLLHYAAEGGQVAVVKYLLENGASTKVGDNEGYYPLESAVRGTGSKEVLDMLKEAAAAESGNQ